MEKFKEREGSQSHSQDRCDCQNHTLASLNTNASLVPNCGQERLVLATMERDRLSALAGSQRRELKHCYEQRDKLGQVCQEFIVV